jgi:hypothetical protein
MHIFKGVTSSEFAQGRFGSQWPVASGQWSAVNGLSSLITHHSSLITFFSACNVTDQREAENNDLRLRRFIFKAAKACEVAPQKSSPLLDHIFEDSARLCRRTVRRQSRGPPP